MTKDADESRDERWEAAMKAADPRFAQQIHDAQEEGKTLAAVPDSVLVGMARNATKRKVAAGEVVTEINRRSRMQPNP
ncbi:MAG TPA: hypothetical protein VGG25_26940 [Streptosporangiaceae bacterium]